MIVIDNLTGQKYVGATHIDIVKQLYNQSHTKFYHKLREKPFDLDQYMKGVVDWLSKSAMGDLKLDGTTVEDRCVSFLSSAIELGLLSKLS